MTDKKKSSNFSAAEVGVLVDEVEMHKSFLFAKFGSNVSNSMKTKLWQDITEKVNAVGVGEVRSIDGVKKKWYDTASKTKKKESCRRREMTATGGGSVGIVLTAEEVKVVEILGDEAVEGISGGFDVGMVGVKAEFKGVMEDEGPSTSRAGTVSLGDGVVVSIQEEDVGRAQQKKKHGADATAELLSVEKKRLKVEEERLEVEKRRLAAEEKRGKLEEQRLELEQQRLALEINRHNCSFIFTTPEAQDG